MTVNFSNLDQCSHDIYSNDKKKRQEARSSLVSLFQSKVPRLNKNQRKTFPQFYQLWTLVNESLTNTFRFPQSNTLPSFVASSRPGYIMIMAHSPNLGQPDEVVQELVIKIKRLWNEAFCETKTDSIKTANKRAALVIGVNYCHSIDLAANKAFMQRIDSLQGNLHKVLGQQAPAIDLSRIQVMAFNWRLNWKKQGEDISQVEVKRFFRLINEIDSIRAGQILKEVMKDRSAVIPYQYIREEIKNHKQVHTFYSEMRRGNRARPLFLVNLDDDAVCYRTEQVGLFSHYDQLIADNENLEVASTGYYMVNENQPFIELASRADLVARVAICAIMANGAYLPEPNLIIKIASLEMLKTRISFLRKGSQRGGGLEYLGLLENLRLNKGDAEGKIIMGRHGPIITTQPPRATVPKHWQFEDALPSLIQKAKHLASLRAFCQSVLNPKKGFAASIARAMPTGAGSAKNTAQISAIYTAFDPIEYAKHIPSWQLCYLLIVEELIGMIDKKQKSPDHYFHYLQRAKKICRNSGVDASEENAVACLLETKVLAVMEAEKLLTIKLLSKTQFRQIWVAALNATSALFAFLSSKLNQEEFIYPANYS